MLNSNDSRLTPPLIIRFLTFFESDRDISILQ